MHHLPHLCLTYASLKFKLISFSEYKLRMFYCHERAFLDQNSSRKDAGSVRQLPDTIDDTFDMDAHNAEELETFGVAYQPLARHTGRNPKEENMKDGRGEEENKEQKTKYQEGQVPESRNLKLPLLDHVTYNTWELRLNQVPFRILIRSFVHAARVRGTPCFISNPFVPDKLLKNMVWVLQPNQAMGGALIPYHMFVKPEYQSHYGVEVLSWEEAAREWAACAITPNSHVLRGLSGPSMFFLSMFDYK